MVLRGRPQAAVGGYTSQHATTFSEKSRTLGDRRPVRAILVRGAASQRIKPPLPIAAMLLNKLD